jgi:hypothetical protein
MSKYSALTQLSSSFAVPPFTALRAEHLESLWEHGTELLLGLEAALASISSTAGAFLDDHLCKVETLLDGLSWTPAAAGWMERHLADQGIMLDDGVAVRSSAAGEDSEVSSFAGMLETVLDVSTPDELLAAITAVWRSNFSRSVIVEKLRTNNLGHADVRDMLVIVQRMVRSSLAGVAFSHSPENRGYVHVEAVTGLGDRHVGGESVDFTLTAPHAQVRMDNFDIEEQGLQAPLLRAAGRLALEVADVWDRPVDLEWAYDGAQLWLLQARPDNSAARSKADCSSVYVSCDLYLSQDAELAALRPLPDFATYFRMKRRPLMVCGREAGAHTGVAVLIHSNAAGIERMSADPRLEAIASSFVVLDLSDKLRQLIMEKEKLLGFLAGALSQRPQSFVVREFIHGDGGLISFVSNTESQEILCEYSSEGLLALNRGTAGSATVRLDETVQFVPQAQREILRLVTVRAAAMFGSVQLEWVTSERGLTLIDFSRISSLPDWTSSNRRTISRGPIIGLAVRVEDSLELHEMSTAAAVSLDEIPSPERLGKSIRSLMEAISGQTQPPILFASRPYAALAALVPHVAGFVFQHSSMLCHLAILLRERGVPAIADEDVFVRTQSGESIFIEN